MSRFLIAVTIVLGAAGCSDFGRYVGEHCAGSPDCRKAMCEHAPDVCK